MARRAPATPARFEEAVAFFRNKRERPLPKPEWLALDWKARQRAFTVARVSNADVLRGVWKDIDRAIAKGESFEQFKKRAAAKLYKAWGEERPWHLETVFRTNLQEAYSYGRRAEMLSPDVLPLRPFFRYVAILDLRTTHVCRQLHGVTRPFNDPFWTRHWPPLLYNCRSTVVSLRPKEGLRRLTPPGDVPHVTVHEGFGNAEPPPWQPDMSRWPPRLRDAFETKQKTKPQRTRRQPAR